MTLSPVPSVRWCVMSQAVSPILRECHRLRRLMRELQSEIDLGPRVLKVQQQKLADEEHAHADAHETVKRVKLKQKEDEGALKQTETRLVKLMTDINSAGSKKEFDAKTTEIATATRQKSDLEDAILTGLGDVEERTAAGPAVEKRWADAQAEFAQQQSDATERLVRLKSELVLSQGLLETAEAKMPP